MTWTLTIQRATPSQNEFAFSHWREGHRSKKLWAGLIRGAKGFLSIPRASGKRRLTVERHGHKALDIPNLIGGAKGIVDNLVQLRLLVDDTPELLEITGLNVALKRGEKPYTVLILEDCQ
ncbi:hypothetical protein [Mesoterricola sediminis]|uniref:Uncharacterized protein n=1 Tax=Mesoterricola sediminis TaxID=2927980 RepID=A0AA48KFB0_9BACT|nr:hypothetical protein [Mesoterricola sediminis]BDU76268.1 hypothetical protein METESE_12260 [Mesoterricola sediminis]